MIGLLVYSDLQQFFRPEPKCVDPQALQPTGHALSALMLQQFVPRAPQR
jgi:hypothetical protein